MLILPGVLSLGVLFREAGEAVGQADVAEDALGILDHLLDDPPFCPVAGSLVSICTHLPV